MKKLLIIDDDVAVTNYLMVFFMQTETYETTVVNDSRDVEGLIEASSFDCILLDMDMPYLSGLDILKKLHEKDNQTPVVVLSGVNDVDMAVKSLKLGAVDFLTKPVEDKHLLSVLDKAIKKTNLNTKINQLPQRLKKEDLEFQKAFDYMPVKSSSMIRVFHQAEKLAMGDLSVFIIGEHGTGKRKLAKAIHNASQRKDNPFVSLDLMAHEPGRICLDLFGESGDWQGQRKDTPGFIEQANEGTLFIDHADLLPLPVQIRLNQLIQSGEFYREFSTKIQKINVRLIAASTHDLSQDKFSQLVSKSFINHLMVHSLQIPPLRKRKEDILPIAHYYLNKENKRMDKNIQGFENAFEDFLLKYSFKGNVQELKDIISHSVVSEEGSVITLDSLSKHVRGLL